MPRHLIRVVAHPLCRGWLLDTTAQNRLQICSGSWRARRYTVSVGRVKSSRPPGSARNGRRGMPEWSVLDVFYRPGTKMVAAMSVMKPHVSVRAVGLHLSGRSPPNGCRSSRRTGRPGLRVQGRRPLRVLRSVPRCRGSRRCRPRSCPQRRWRRVREDREPSPSGCGADDAASRRQRREIFSFRRPGPEGADAACGKAMHRPTRVGLME